RSALVVSTALAAAAASTPSLHDALPILPGAFERRQRRAHHRDPGGVGTFDELAVDGDELFGFHRAPAVADVVDPFEQHHGPNPRPAPHVAVEAGEGGIAGGTGVGEQSVTADTAVEHAAPVWAGALQESIGDLIGIAQIG